MRSPELALLSWPGHAAIRRPIVAGAAIVLLVLASLAAATQLRFDADIYRSFSSNNPHLQAYSSFLDRLGGKPRQILVLAEADAPLGLGEFETLRDIALDIELLDHVAAVVSAATTRFPQDARSHAGEPVMPLGVDVDAFARRLEAFDDAKPLSAMLLSADRRSALLHVAIADDAPADAPVIVAAGITRLIDAAAPPGIRVGMTGEDLLGPEIVEALKRDLALYTVAGGLIALLAAGWLFRDWRLVTLCVAPAGLAGLTPFLFYAIFAIPVTVINNILPILVFVLALADSVHLTVAHARERLDGDTARAAARIVDSVGPACALTAITTAIAFGAISISDDVQIRELSLLGATGVMAGYLVVIMAYPVLARLLAPHGQARQDKAPSPVGTLAAAAAGASGRVVVAGVALTLVGLVLCLRAEPWFTLERNLPVGSDTRIVENRVAFAFGGFYRLWIEFDGDETVEHRRGLENAASGYPVLSRSVLSEWLGDEMNSDALAGLNMLSALTPDGAAVSRHLVLMPEPMHSDAALARYDRIEAAALSLGASTVTGLPAVLRHEPAILIGHMAWSLVIACALACVLLAIVFRDAMLAPVLVLPNLLPLLLAAGTLAALSGGRIGPSETLALTVAFGIAVDDSIHFVSRYTQARGDGLEPRPSVQRAVEQAGRPMVITTILICAGLSVPILSSFETVRAFAIIQIAALVVALVADLLLLPALMMVRERIR